MPSLTAPPARQGVVKRPREACTNCRALKSRCLPLDQASLTSKDPCQRCFKSNLDCSYARRKRGRPRKHNASSPETSTPRQQRPRRAQRVSRSKVEDEAAGSPSSPSSPLSQSQSLTHDHDLDHDQSQLPPELDFLADHFDQNQYQPPLHLSPRTAMGMMDTGLPHSVGDGPGHLAGHFPPLAISTASLSFSQPVLPSATSILSSSTLSIPGSSSFGTRAEAISRDRNPSLFRDSTSGIGVVADSTFPAESSNTSAVRFDLVHEGSGTTGSAPVDRAAVSSPAARPSTNVVHLLEPHLGVDDSRPPSPRRRERGSVTDDEGETILSSITTTSRHPESTLRQGSRTRSRSSKRPALLGPVELGILTELEAQHLFARFVDRLSPMGALFDHAFHTYERVSQSAALFTAILSASARFFRPELWEPLHDHAQAMINRQVNVGSVDIGTVQALLVLVIWKQPNDRSAYIKVGLAVRLACQLRLGVKRQTPLPANDMEARSVLDAERTWISLANCDMSYSHIFHLPAANADPGVDDAYVNTWASEHSYLDIPGDFNLAFCAGFGAPDETYKEFVEHGETDSDSTIGWQLVMRERIHSQRLQNWLMRPELTGMYRDNACVTTALLILHLRSQQVHLTPNDVTKSGLIAMAEEAVEHISRIAQSGFLPYWSDLISTTVSVPGLFLYKARSYFNNAEIGRALAVVRRFKVICTDLLEESHTDHALYYILRFYRRLQNVFEKLNQGEQTTNQDHMDVGTDVRAVIELQWEGLGDLYNENTIDYPTSLDSIWQTLWGFEQAT